MIRVVSLVKLTDEGAREMGNFNARRIPGTPR